MNVGKAAACVIALLLAACAPTGSVADPSGPPRTTRSCADTAAAAPLQGDLYNVVYFGRRQLTAPGHADSDVDFGRVVGRVRCTTFGSLTPVDYELREGDATHVPAGQPLHQVAERPTSDAVGAYLEGRPYVFVTERELLARADGRCEVPMTQACPS